MYDTRITAAFADHATYASDERGSMASARTHADARSACEPLLVRIIGCRVLGSVARRVVCSEAIRFVLYRVGSDADCHDGATADRAGATY